MRITTTAQVWLVISAMNAIGCAIVAPTVMVFYPRAEWPFELTLGLGLTCSIATPFTYLMARQLQKNTLLSDKLQRLVDSDRLTDTRTRRYFFDRMQSASEDYGVCLMIDIDHFKTVNDTYGHLAGDRVIQDVASRIKAILRDADIIARFGGEEFVVFLNRVDPATGFSISERIRNTIAERPISFNDIPIDVSVSVGGSPMMVGSEIERVIQDADAALYRAKAKGRNCTIFSSDPFNDDQPLDYEGHRASRIVAIA